MRKIVKELFFLLSIILAISTQAFSDQSPLKIGVILPLSGSFSDYGYAIKNGLQLALQENKTNKLEFIFEDDQYDSKLSLTAYRKLVDINKVDVFYVFGGAACTALAPIVDKEDKLIINFSADEAPALNSINVIRSINSTKDYAGVLIKYLRQIGVVKFQIVNFESSFTNSMLRSFRNALNEKEVLEEVYSVNPTDLDFRSILLRIRQSKNTHIGMFLRPEQMVNFSKQAKEFKLNFSLFGTNGIESALLLAQDKGTLEGAVYPFHNVDENFLSAYKAQYGIDLQLPFAGNAYDLTKLIIENIDSINSKEDLRRVFLNVKNRRGTLGPFSYQDDSLGGKYFRYPMVIKKVEKGIFIVEH